MNLIPVETPAGTSYINPDHITSLIPLASPGKMDKYPNGATKVWMGVVHLTVVENIDNLYQRIYETQSQHFDSGSNNPRATEGTQPETLE